MRETKKERKGKSRNTGVPECQKLCICPFFASSTEDVIRGSSSNVIRGSSSNVILGSSGNTGYFLHGVVFGSFVKFQRCNHCSVSSALIERFTKLNLS